MTTSEFPIPAASLTSLLAGALDRSANDGARIVALHWLDRLVDARNDWQRSVDDANPVADDATAVSDAADALHRARVALRRLRATLREHRDSLNLDEGRRARRALQRLGKATNRVRDRDAQREWLSGERDGLSDEARRDADVLLASLSASATKDAATVAHAFTRFLDPVAPHLAKRLSRYTALHVVGQSATPLSFARHLADRVERGCAHLRHELRMVTDIGAQEVLHRVRIRLKRQRAMLSPFAHVHPDIGAWYAMATQGQKRLGAMRDAALLATKADKRELRALSNALQAVALSHYEAFAAQWGDAAGTVTRTKDAAVAALRSKDPAAGLPMEIERKFLLHGLPPEAAIAPSMRIEQGWIPGSVIRERLRRSTHPNGMIDCTRTIKLGEPGARIEVEEPTDPMLFDQLWPHTAGARIRKRRHLVRDGALLWEIDVFLDRDLVLAEVELEAVDQVVDIPAWLTPFIVREVTAETAYLNSVMALQDAGTPARELH